MRSSISIADASDRERIYQIRHDVYAAELGQHAENENGVLTDSLDTVNTYLIAKVDGVIAGFVSITPPTEAGYSLDKYFAREDLPLVFDDSLYEVRLLTVTPAFRGSRSAMLLMYAAYRYVESVGGTSIVSIGRLEMVEMYKRAGLRSLGRQIRAGQVTYELMTTATGCEHAGHASTLAKLERQVDWRVRGVSFRRGGACYHGGAFFDAIGDEFDRVDARHAVINADVLDAWFDPAPGVIQALQSELPWILRTSPPTDCAGMQRSIARARGVAPSNILPGAGSSDLIFLGLRHWVDAGSRVLILDPMYGEYAHVLEEMIGCTVDRLPLSRELNYAVDLRELEERLRTRYDWVILVNPNSPTGQHVDTAKLKALICGSPLSTRFWIDETYIEYAGSSHSLEMFAAASKNVVVCKSMSKVYALSGVRCAYLCGPSHLMDDLRSISPPWSVSLPGQIAACEALRQTAYYEERWRETHALREELAKGLASLGWDVVPGCANFLLCHLPSSQPTAADLAKACQRRGLFIRDVSNMGSCFDTRTVRVAVKDAKTNRKILDCLHITLAELRRANRDIGDQLSIRPHAREMFRPRINRDGIAHSVTVLTNPSFLSGFFFIALSLSFVAPGRRLTVAVVALSFATLAPVLAVLALCRAGRVTDLALRERAERPLVYAVSALIYSLGTVALVAVGAPWQIWGVMALHIPTMAILSALTQRDKISIHTTGIAALWAASLVLWGAVVLPLGLLLPAAAWGRWTLGAHTRHELAAGALLGLVSVGAGLLMLRTFLGV